MNKYIVARPLVLGVGTALLLAGCATAHYQVTDPHSGNKYFTERIENLGGGSVKLQDARTGSIVTLQNTEVKEISSEAYKEGIAAPPSKPVPTTESAPAAAPTPAAAPAPTPNAAPTPEPSGKY